MKSITKTFLTLSLLIPLAGCWDSGCCKKDKKVVHVEKAGQPATPKANCSHVGCSHDHSKEVVSHHEEPISHDELMNSDEK